MTERLQLMMPKHLIPGMFPRSNSCNLSNSSKLGASTARRNFCDSYALSDMSSSISTASFDPFHDSRSSVSRYFTTLRDSHMPEASVAVAPQRSGWRNRLTRVLKASKDRFKEKLKKKITARSGRNISPFKSSKNQSHVAATAVLDTNELLHQILSHIPIEDFFRIRRVSKTWNKVASDIGYHLDPVRVCDEADSRYPSLPMYACEVPITFNPVFYVGPSPSDDGSPKFYYLYLMYDGYFDLDLARSNEFLTNPPVTLVSLSIRDPWKPVAMLRVRDGIRLRHLVKVIRKIYKGIERPTSRPLLSRRASYNLSISLNCKAVVPYNQRR